jgi:hypothetical protein
MMNIDFQKFRSLLVAMDEEENANVELRTANVERRSKCNLPVFTSKFEVRRSTFDVRILHFPQ